MVREAQKPKSQRNDDRTNESKDRNMTVKRKEPKPMNEAEKLLAAIASLVAIGFTEEEARHLLDETLRDMPSKGSA